MANLFATYLFTTSNIFEYELGMKLFKHIYVQINRMIFIDKIHEVIAIIHMYQFLFKAQDPVYGFQTIVN